MQDNQEKLYEDFEELLYVIAMVDGFIQEEEVKALEQILAEHPWAASIKRSFNYERQKSSFVDDMYAKVLDYCQFRGPSSRILKYDRSYAGCSRGFFRDRQR